MATVASAPFTADDGAPDDAAAAVAPLLAAQRIRFIATGNHGVSAACNTAIAETSASLIALRAVRSPVRGPVLTLSFALWRVMTTLARPMLGWRQRAMARETKCPALAAMLAGGGA